MPRELSRTPVLRRSSRTSTPIRRSLDAGIGDVVSTPSPVIHDSNFSDTVQTTPCMPMAERKALQRPTRAQQSRPGQLKLTCLLAPFVVVILRMMVKQSGRGRARASWSYISIVQCKCVCVNSVHPAHIVAWNGPGLMQTISCMQPVNLPRAYRTKLCEIGNSCLRKWNRRIRLCQLSPMTWLCCVVNATLP